jgi:hypothetical protein
LPDSLLVRSQRGVFEEAEAATGKSGGGEQQE